MPIAKITLAPDLVEPLGPRMGEITDGIAAILSEGLSAKPQLVQVVLTAALCAPKGCAVLCEVQHRGSAARTAEIRESTAQRLHDLLHDATAATVRVRLIALDPADIAAIDSPEALT